MTTFTFTPLKSQYETMARSYPLSQWENKTYNPAEMNDNFWAAEVAGRMFDRATQADNVCEANDWQNEHLNIMAHEAWHEHDAFVNTFKRVHGLPHKRMVARGNESGVTEYDPALRVDGSEDVF